MQYWPLKLWPFILDQGYLSYYFYWLHKEQRGMKVLDRLYLSFMKKSLWHRCHCYCYWTRCCTYVQNIVYCYYCCICKYPFGRFNALQWTEPRSLHFVLLTLSQEQEEKHNPERVWHYWYPPVKTHRSQRAIVLGFIHSDGGRYAVSISILYAKGQQHSFTCLFHNPPFSDSTKMAKLLQVLVDGIYDDLCLIDVTYNVTYNSYGFYINGVVGVCSGGDEGNWTPVLK